MNGLKCKSSQVKQKPHPRQQAVQNMWDRFLISDFLLELMKQVLEHWLCEVLGIRTSCLPSKDSKVDHKTILEFHSIFEEQKNKNRNFPQQQLRIYQTDITRNPISLNTVYGTIIRAKLSKIYYSWCYTILDIIVIQIQLDYTTWQVNLKFLLL